MEFLVQLWLPIVASAVAVWIVSAIIWMALPTHKKDFDKLPDEQAFMAAVKALNIPPGNYGYPFFGDRSNCNTPEAKRAMEEGPIGILNNWKPGMKMGKSMVLTFLVYLVVSFLIAYMAWHALHRGPVLPGSRPAFGDVMQLTGTAGVLAYAFAFLPNGIWFQAKCRALVFCVIDGVVYGLVTGAIFAWLWPHA